MIRRQVVLPVDPERLWTALTDPEEVAAWLGGRVEWEVREGAPFCFHDDAGEVRDGRVEAVRPMRHLRFRWWPAGDPGAGEGEATEVSYLLESVVDGTRLTVQELVVRRLGAADLDPGGPDRAGPDRREPQALAGSWSAWDTRMAGAWYHLARRGVEPVGA
ncbi:MAG: SRPBCC family protein [Acidimicrobiales bacterium]